jgi:hypothetical protein
VAPLIERLGRIDALIDVEPEAAVLARVRAAETTGRPLARTTSWRGAKP